MFKRGNRSWAGLKALVAVGAGSLAMAGSAGAATATHPNGGSGFGTGVEGWSSSGSSCTPIELLCSTEAAHDTTTGNPPGSIVVETTATLNLISLFKGTATWTSPEFTIPVGAITAADLGLDRVYSPGALVDVGPTASYAVTLTDLTNGISTEVLSEVLDETDDAYAGASAPVAVVGGHRYQLRIDAEIVQSTLALSLLSGTTGLGFDNVGVVVQAGGDGKDGAGGKGDGDGYGGKGDGDRRKRSSVLSGQRLLSLLRQGPAVGPAVLKGNRLFVKVNCPASIGRGCRISAQGRLSRRVAATAVRTVKVGKGKGRQVALRVKPKQLAKVKKRKRLLVREKVRAGSVKATIQKSRKLIRR